jgi:methylmalonyl-CoA mutase N-terminal domain/subunit
MAGSYAIEELTTQLEEKAAAYIEKIDAMGGMLRAIESGYVQREIQEAAYEYQLAVEKQDAIVVGVNRFQTEEKDTIPTLKINEQIERDQVARLRSIREKRDAVLADAAMASLAETAAGSQNLLPKILECVEAYVTVGEISHTLRKVWGEYQEAVTV